MNLKRLPLRGIHNFRDLGGYPVGFDKMTKWKTFFRADGLFDIQKEDMDFILDYCGIETVIDLRGAQELEQRPNSFQNMPGIRFENVPFINEDRAQHEVADEWKILDAGYLDIARNSREKIKKAFDIIGETLPGAVLYNCTAGKDRTGILSCLLLATAGVPERDIISDYQVSCTYILKDAVRVAGDSVVDMAYIRSDPKTLKGFIDFVTQEEGSLIGFIKACGVSSDCLSEIKAKFVVDIKQ